MNKPDLGVEYNIFHKAIDLKELKLVTRPWGRIWKTMVWVDFSDVCFKLSYQLIFTHQTYWPIRIFVGIFIFSVLICVFFSPWKWGTICLCTKKVGARPSYLWSLLYLSYVLHPVLAVVWATPSWRILITLWPIQAVLVDSSIRIGNLQNLEHTVNTQRYNSSLSGPQSYLLVGRLLYCV